MFKLDNAFLEELGLGTLPAVEKNKMLAHIYETLEMRVGMRLAEQMSNEQLDEFESYINRQDEAGALKWLETNFPDYKQVVAEELEKLKGEIKQVAPQIVAQAQTAAAQQTPLQAAPQQLASQQPIQVQQPPIAVQQQQEIPPAQPQPQQYLYEQPQKLSQTPVQNIDTLNVQNQPLQVQPPQQPSLPFQQQQQAPPVQPQQQRWQPPMQPPQEPWQPSDE